MTDLAVTSGRVCAHHHLYSSLARGMPAPPHQPTDFLDILNQVWWRLDDALDLNMIYWSAALGALEALQSGTTTIIDHHESPTAIEGSLSAIAQGCALVGVEVITCYGATDRWADDDSLVTDWSRPPAAMTDGARRGLEECHRFISAGGRGMVGLHAAFTCSDETIATAASMASDLGVGVHVHVAEGECDRLAGQRLAPYATDDWLLIHAVHLDSELPGTIVHNARSNMNNSVGYARPADRTNTIALGTDGIGADMMEEFRLTYVAHRSNDVLASPEASWQWMRNGYLLAPEAEQARVRWNYDHPDSAWHVAFTPGMRALDVTSAGGEELLRNGDPTRVDASEVRAKAAEAASRLFQRLEEM